MRTLRCRSSMLCIFSSFSARRIERNSVDKEGSCVRVDRIVPPGKPSFHRFRLEKFRQHSESSQRRFFFFFDTTRARSPSSDHSSGRSHVNRRRSFDIVLLKLSPRGHHLRQSHQQRRVMSAPTTIGSPNHPPNPLASNHAQPLSSFVYHPPTTVSPTSVPPPKLTSSLVIPLPRPITRPPFPHQSSDLTFGSSSSGRSTEKPTAFSFFRRGSTVPPPMMSPLDIEMGRVTPRFTAGKGEMEMTAVTFGDRTILGQTGRSKEELAMAKWRVSPP